MTYIQFIHFLPFFYHHLIRLLAAVFMYLKYVYKGDTSQTCIDCLRIYQDINHSELERFDAQRKVDFLEMLKGFVHNQVYPKFLDF